ncbi:unnamed protein product, partial [Cylicostephanus goldi]
MLVKTGVSFATVAEKEIIDSIVANKGLTKVSINLRLPEGRHKVENATLRNGEYKRVLRREAALRAKQEAEELAKNPVPQLPKEPKKEVKKPVIAAAKKEKDTHVNDAKPVAPKSTASTIKNETPTKAIPSQITNPTVASTAKEKKNDDVASDRVPRNFVVPKKKLVEPNEPEAASSKPRLPSKVSMLARRLSNVDTNTPTPVLRVSEEKEVPRKVLPQKPGFLPDEEDIKAATSAKKNTEKESALKRPESKVAALKKKVESDKKEPAVPFKPKKISGEKAENH